MSSPDTDHGTASVWAAGCCWLLLRHSLHCCCSDLTTHWALWHQNQTEMLLLTPPRLCRQPAGACRASHPPHRGCLDPTFHLQTGYLSVTHLPSFTGQAGIRKESICMKRKQRQNTSEGLQEEAGWSPAEEPMGHKLSEEAHNLPYVFYTVSPAAGVDPVSKWVFQPNYTERQLSRHEEVPR